MMLEHFGQDRKGLNGRWGQVVTVLVSSNLFGARNRP